MIGNTGNDSHDDESEGRVQSNRVGGGESRSGRGKSDSQSAGRKIAAKLYPLTEDAPCEWRNQSECGGGNFPILGCLEGTQQARHHGPEKNVQNNDQGNVHRICHYCHYRWHAKNDPTYDWNAGVWPPHNPRPHTPKEQREQAVDYMRYMATKKTKVKELD